MLVLQSGAHLLQGDVALLLDQSAQEYLLWIDPPPISQTRGLARVPLGPLVGDVAESRMDALSTAPGAHAVLLLDQAGWHTTKKLTVPDNMTLLPLPAYSPELNPVENLWQFLRDTWLGNRIFQSYDDIIDHCCEAWNKIIAQLWRIASIGLRQWAHAC